MPELPEVEIVRQSLDKKIKKKTIKKVIIRNRNLRFKIPSNFESFVKNKKIIQVNRFSKYLILSFQDGVFCLIHMGMSGTIHIIDKKKTFKFTNTSFYHSHLLPKKHNHVELIFENFKVFYNDPRRFGFFEIIKNLDDLKKRNTYFKLKFLLNGSGPKYLNLLFKSSKFSIISKKPKRLGSL